MPLGPQILGHPSTAVGGKSAPEQGHPLAEDVTQEVLEEADQALLVVAAGLSCEVYPRALPVSEVAERCRS